LHEKFRRYFLKTREAEALFGKVSEKLKLNLKQIFKTQLNVELIQTEFAEIYIINGKPLLAKIENTIFPTLIFTEFAASAPKVFIDMGAVPHVCNGANIMAPGITSFAGKFKEGDFVLVVDEKYCKPIAIGEVMYDIDSARKVASGVVVKNIHYVGDRIWNFIKKIFDLKCSEC